MGYFKQLDVALQETELACENCGEPCYTVWSLDNHMWSDCPRTSSCCGAYVDPDVQFCSKCGERA